MLSGSIIAKELIDEMIDEIDVSLPEIKRKKYYDWINKELYHIYTFAVKILGVNLYKSENLAIDLSKPYEPCDLDFDFDAEPDPPKPELVNCNENIDDITVEDVYKVYGDANDEYAKGTYSAFMPKAGKFYFINNGKLHVNCLNDSNAYKILFYKRPSKVNADNESTYIIPLPDGFMDIIRAGIRREVFLLSGEVQMSNAWGEYHNVMFNQLKSWYSEKEPVCIR